MPGPEWETCSRKYRWPTELLCDAACLHEGRSPGKKEACLQKETWKSSTYRKPELKSPRLLESSSFAENVPHPRAADDRRHACLSSRAHSCAPEQLRKELPEALLFLRTPPSFAALLQEGKKGGRKEKEGGGKARREGCSCSFEAARTSFRGNNHGE